MIGSSVAARRAGQTPNTTPTTAENTNDAMIAEGEIKDAATLAALWLLRLRGVAPWA